MGAKACLLLCVFASATRNSPTTSGAMQLARHTQQVGTSAAGRSRPGRYLLPARTLSTSTAQTPAHASTRSINHRSRATVIRAGSSSSSSAAGPAGQSPAAARPHASTGHAGRVPPAAAAAVSTADAPQQQQNGQQQGQEQFDWLRAWYPVAIVSQLDPARPSAIQLLGRQMVAWHNPKTKLWSVFEDRCPHRLAPLSEGRIEASTGNLMCSYHGWQFNGEGRCTSIPQIGEPAGHKTATESRRTCAINYPCQVAQGLLWVWPDAASSAQAGVTPPPLTEHWGNKDWTLLGGEWFARDMEYGFDTLMENLFDPSHIPFAHHKIMGPATRDKVQPLEVTTTTEVTAQGGFQLARDKAPYKTPDITDTVNLWKPPCLNCSIQTNRRTQRTLVLTFYGIPLEPGRSRVITAFFTNGKVPPIAQKLTKAFEWVFHMGQNQVLDSDAMLLHIQERMLHDGADNNWRSAFFMPAQADTGIIKFRTWYHDCAGGEIPWPGAPAGQKQPLGPAKSREAVMDRLNQHTLQCKACSAALKWVQRLQAASLAAAGFAAAIAVSVVTAAATAAAQAGSAAAAATPSFGAWLAAIPSWQAGMAAAVAVLMLVGHQVLGQVKRRFMFMDYVHAAIP